MPSNLRSAAVYAGTIPYKLTAFRQVSGYALTQSVDPVYLRQVAGYILVDVIKRPNVAIPGRDGLLAAINKEKLTSFTAAQLTFATPQPNPDTNSAYNTTILVTAKKVSGYSGSYTFQYTRFPIAEAFDGQALTLPSSVGTTIWGTLAEINTKFGVKLDQTDVADGPIAPDATSILLTTLASSIYFTPGSTIRIGSTDSDIAFATVAPVTDLLGFDPEA